MSSENGIPTHVERTSVMQAHEEPSSAPSPAPLHPMTETPVPGILRNLPEHTAHARTIGEEFVDLKKNLQKVILSLERLGVSLKESGQVMAEEGSVEIVKRSVLDMPGTSSTQRASTRGGGGGERGGRSLRGLRGPRHVPRKPFTPRKPNWTLKVLDPRGLEPAESMDKIEMKESTKKCLKADGITEAGYIERNILAQLISGDDTILQIRGHKLENYTLYPIIDVLDGGAPDLQVIILINRLDAHSSKTFLASLEKHMEVAGTDAALHVVPQDRDLDLKPLLRNTPNKPSIYVTPPEMMGRMMDEGVIKPQAVHVLAVYEAEYVLRTPSHIETISKALKEFEVCQVILSSHEGTEDVLRAAEAFEFLDETVVFSMDHSNIHSADHYLFLDNALINSLLDHAIGYSKDSTVVIICHDGPETIRLKEELSARADAVTIPKAAEHDKMIGGLLLTSQLSNNILQTRAHKPVKMILNISGIHLNVDRYFELMASYMDVGYECEIFTKVGTIDALKDLKTHGLTFKEVAGL